MEMRDWLRKMKCSCSNGLCLGMGRAFYCIQCSKKGVILCEECATFCHPLHEIHEIKLVKDDFLKCDCGNSRSVNEICLLDSTKPALNSENVYVFYGYVPKFNPEYYNRRWALLSESGKIYIDRAIDLAAKRCYLASMEDVNTAIAWDCEHVKSRILKIDDTGAFVARTQEMLNDFLISIATMDLTLLHSVEVVMRFCERLKSTLNHLKQKTKGVDRDLLIDALGLAKDAILEQFWERAATLDVIHIGSRDQFHIYQKFVMPKRKETATLKIGFEFLDFSEKHKFCELLTSLGILYSY